MGSMNIQKGERFVKNQL